jgi:anti-sigma B factor antagonist
VAGRAISTHVPAKAYGDRFPPHMTRHVGFSIHTSEGGDGLVVRPEGELDLATSPELERLVLGRLDAGGAVVLDLRGLEFMDSSGLRLVVMADMRARETGRRFTLVRGGDTVHRVFEITRMSERLDFVDAPEDAR